MNTRVLISIVSYNSGHHLQPCLDSLRAQAFKSISIAVWDNASSDATREVVVKNSEMFDAVHFSERNIGFCAAHNRLISSKESDYVLVLNPDVVLGPRFLEILVDEMDRDLSAGSATGKLLRPKTAQETGETLAPEVLDTTGIYLTRNQRHFDRGSGEFEKGRYDRPEYVFGASGAAALYRREMLEDTRDGQEYFDESFFAYREDVDLAWRAQWMGWNCLYIPEAVGHHGRRVLPERRAILPDAINMHSFKNRFLLRIKNMDLGTYARYFIPIMLRDVMALSYVALFEWSSLPGLYLLIRALPKAWNSRQNLKKRRRASAREVRSWFSSRQKQIREFSKAEDRQRR
jgi:GT2 family glycosyltransferase